MNSWIDVAGWTLLYFLWQGAAIAVVTAIALRLLPHSRPQLRYAAACAAMALMLTAPVATALLIGSTPARLPFVSSSIHPLRTPAGTVAGIAVTQHPAGTGSSDGYAAPSDLRFPLAIDMDSVLRWTVAFWSLGVLVLLTRLGTGCWRLRELQNAARLESPSRWQPLAEEIASRLGLRPRFSVVDSFRVTAPMVAGWLQPVILLPAAAMTGLSTQQVEAILAHELAHIRRHDFLVNLLQTLAETALFYHPAVWWLSARIRDEREHCCDDVAVALCGDAREYAAALTQLAAWSVTHAPLAMAATQGSLVGRVRRLLRAPAAEDAGSRRSVLAVSLVLGGVLIAGALGAIVRAQPFTRADGRLPGPPDINRMLGYELFPGPVRLPTDDPLGNKAWTVSLEGNGITMPFIGFTARGLIRQAYDLGEMPIAGTPRWMDDEWFELTIPADLRLTANGLTDAEQVQKGLQRFFEDRMGLVTHRERREFPAYAMVLARKDGTLGPNISPSTAECFGATNRTGDNPPASAGSLAQAPALAPRLEGRTSAVQLRVCGFDNHLLGLKGVRVTMADLAGAFDRQSPLTPDREVVDRTGLTGTYDIDLRFGLLPVAAIAHANPTFGALLHPFGIRSVFTAMPEQLGLKLVDGTVSHDVLVIDQINRP